MPNSKFARFGENAVRRIAELAGEELRLFMYILFHSKFPPYICEFKLRTICKIYGLNPDHSYGRFDELQRKGWCDMVGKYPRPLVGTKLEKTSKIEVNELQKLKSSELHIRNIDLKQDCLDTTTTEKPDVVVKTNGHKSQFSKEECRRYVELCEQEGQTVKNHIGLTTYLYESGEKDALILAKLYPKRPEQITSVSYDRDAALAMLAEMKAEGLSISGMQQFYEEDWEWLQQQLNNQ